MNQKTYRCESDLDDVSHPMVCKMVKVPLVTVGDVR